MSDGDSFRARLERALAGGAESLDRPDLVPSAVLIPIVIRGGEPRVIFTRRTMSVAHHKGQISFPGGAAEPGDRDAVDTALREAGEEIGLERALVEVAGRLEDQVTTTGFVVAPVVGLVDERAALCRDPREVAEVFELAWSRLIDPVALDVEMMEHRGVTFRNHRFTVGDKVVWGATGRILARLIEKVGQVEQP
ncbi:MAG: CoA pyrophosphatase [Polyangia bacterium]